VPDSALHTLPYGPPSPASICPLPPPYP
jgi:hypothetical protein